MKIIHKDKWGFWIFTRYSFILEDEDESITEIAVDKNKWEKFNVGDCVDSHYKQFYKNDKQN